MVASSGTQISDEGRAALRMVKDEMNSKRGPDERDCTIYSRPEVILSDTKILLYSIYLLSITFEVHVRRINMCSLLCALKQGCRQ